MPASAKRGGASRRIEAAASSIRSPPSVEATVTGPERQSCGICSAKISLEQSSPGTSTTGVTRMRARLAEGRQDSDRSRSPWVAFVRAPSLLRGAGTGTHRTRPEPGTGTASDEGGLPDERPYRPQPAELAETPVKQSADHGHQAQDRPVAPAGVRRGQICEVH